jgi:hypothetical protein
MRRDMERQPNLGERMLLHLALVALSLLNHNIILRGQWDNNKSHQNHAQFLRDCCLTRNPAGRGGEDNFGLPCDRATSHGERLVRSGEARLYREASRQ